MDKEWERQQKKTFTVWVNYQLKKSGIVIKDLTEDLRDGKVFLRLLEAISGEPLPLAEKKDLRVHRISNVNKCLDFIARKGVKLAGIGSEELVDGNMKMTLGCIWVIILRFAIQVPGDLGKNDGLLLWVKKKTEGYKNVNVQNFTTSFRDGLAFSALIHRHRPDLIDFDSLKKESEAENLTNAFDVAEKELGIPRMLEVEDTRTCPDQKSVMTYVSAFYHEFSKNQVAENAARRINRVFDTSTDNASKIQDYERIASDLLEWIQTKTAEFEDLGQDDDTLDVLLARVSQMNKYRSEEKPPKAKDKAALENLVSTIKTRMHLQNRPEFVPLEGHSIRDIQSSWNGMNNREKILLERLYMKMQQLYFIEHQLKKYYARCDQQNSWMRGRIDPLREDVSQITMSHLIPLKMKMVELTNDIDTRVSRLLIITSLRDRLRELKCQDMLNVDSRHSEIFKNYDELKNTHSEFSQKLSEREKCLEELDRIKKLYSQLASSLTATLDTAIEDLSDTYQVQSISETEDLLQELEVFLQTISEAEKKLQEAVDLETQINQSSDSANLYCSVTCEELKAKLGLAKEAVDQRRSQLSGEKNVQEQNDTIRKEYAKVAQDIDEFKNSSLQRVQESATISCSLEERISLLKLVADDVDTFYKQHIPILEAASKAMQENKIFHNPLTSHTDESINSDYQNMFNLIASSINEIENQIIVRDGTNITEQQVKDYRKSFDYFDKDHLNFLSYESFRNFLVSLEFNVTEGDVAAEREFNRICSKVDRDGIGKIYFNDFLNFVARESKDVDSSEQTIESFRILAGGKEYITPEQLRQHLPKKADLIIQK
ncbi:hypothetical protein MXB_5306, partial [Myxobolus squamalis]